MESPLCRTDTRLIETFGWDGRSFLRLEAHLARAHASAQVLGFRWDRAAIARALSAISGPASLRVRLTIGRNGDARVTSAPLPPNPDRWRLMIAEERLCSSDLLLRHKTTERAHYDQARAALPDGIDEAVFFNERGEACEGTISNLFFDLGDGLKTPPLAAGCLPGILRAELLAGGKCHEATLLRGDLDRAGLWMGNALRGLIPAVIGAGA